MAAAVIAALGGCAAPDRLTAQYHDARRAVGLDQESARPATQLSLIMQRRLASLPDPLHPDAQQVGLPGQVFLIGTDGKPVTAAGDLTLTVTDDTPRPPGQPARTTEKWHFTPDVLPQLRTKDERFGECYVLFLPWKADWKDVTRVTVKGHYKAAGSVELFAQEVTINLDLSPAAGGGETWKRIDPFVVPPSDPRPTTTPQPIPLPPPSPAPMLLPTPTPGSATPQVPAGPQTIVLPRG